MRYVLFAQEARDSLEPQATLAPLEDLDPLETPDSPAPLVCTHSQTPCFVWLLTFTNMGSST